ncbi:alpha/beta fold hydrolase [Salinibacterium soli]|uniref:Alpha/beta fold hydrolase n=1 Tax=Antiquaquibacter soli TaxID=3064523 RepID=A0ABT9BP46_9MICO|nr:alpha/beta hydrolase [Protaetiibacter sp. WY-16]MDO7882812.1 alpha/beta fold hydrolase [Protaetiibacter sp. WY-16]
MTAATRPAPRLVPTRLGRLAVREYGAGAAAVLWHGLLVDSASWSRVIPPLAEHRRLIVVDGPGHGDSDELARVTTIARCADAAVDLLDALGLVDPVDWVGSAWGGHVGYAVDAAHPGRLSSLVAIESPTEPASTAERRRLRALRPVLRVAGRGGFVVRLVAEAQLTDYSRAVDAEAVAIVRESLRRQSRRSLSTSIASFVLRRADLEADLVGGSAPALLVASDDRGYWTPESVRRAAGRRAGATATTVSWSRMLVPIEQPAALSREIVGFWRGLG